MEGQAEVISDGSSVIEEFARASGKSFEAAFVQTSRGAVRHVIAITPPASASGVPGGLDNSSAAKARGARAIERDLYRVFQPVRLKHKRRERISGAEMYRIHLERLNKKRPGAAMTRGRAQPYYVDVRKFNVMRDTLRSHVGRLASGWLPAAEAVSVATPQWITRHGVGRGTFRGNLQGSDLYIEAVNLTSSHAPVEELRRRTAYAVQYSLNDLRRQLPVLAQRAAQRSGLATS